MIDAKPLRAFGSGVGLGTADLRGEARLAALGIGRGVGAADLIESRPAVRRDEATMIYDDSVEFDLGLDDS